MVRTQVQLTDEQFKTLKTMAADQGLSVAELIRRGVDLYINTSGSIASKDRINRAIGAAGRFCSGLGDLSENHDEYLVEAFLK